MSDCQVGRSAFKSGFPSREQGGPVSKTTRNPQVENRQGPKQPKRSFKPTRPPCRKSLVYCSPSQLRAASRSHGPRHRALLSAVLFQDSLCASGFRVRPWDLRFVHAPESKVGVSAAGALNPQIRSSQRLPQQFLPRPTL